MHGKSSKNWYQSAERQEHFMISWLFVVDITSLWHIKFGGNRDSESTQKKKKTKKTTQQKNKQKHHGEKADWVSTPIICFWTRLYKCVIDDSNRARWRCRLFHLQVRDRHQRLHILGIYSHPKVNYVQNAFQTYALNIFKMMNIYLNTFKNSPFMLQM